MSTQLSVRLFAAGRFSHDVRLATMMVSTAKNLSTIARFWERTYHANPMITHHSREMRQQPKVRN